MKKLFEILLVAVIFFSLGMYVGQEKDVTDTTMVATTTDVAPVNVKPEAKPEPVSKPEPEPKSVAVPAPVKSKNLAVVYTFDEDIETENETGANIAIAPVETDGIKLVIENGWVSYSYGQKVEAPIVKYSRTAEVPAEFVTCIATGRVPSVEEIERITKSLKETMK